MSRSGHKREEWTESESEREGGIVVRVVEMKNVGVRGDISRNRGTWYLVAVNATRDRATLEFRSSEYNNGDIGELIAGQQYN